MLTVLYWALIGLAAGALARLLIPGKQPIGLLLTIGLGLLGSVVGGLLSWLFTEGGPSKPYHPAGLLMSTVGATIALGLFVLMGKRSNA